MARKKNEGSVMNQGWYEYTDESGERLYYVDAEGTTFILQSPHGDVPDIVLRPPEHSRPITKPEGVSLPAEAKL